jgi:predicted nuclease of restriction endonuclease-like (RecB) superfamily
MIVEKQKKYGWGKSIVENLSSDLQKEFPGINGLSQRNFWRMRNFYSEYKEYKKLPQLVAEIGWSHNIIIMEKCKDITEREFYIKMTKKFGWSKNVLTHQIENQSYQKYLLNQTNFEKTLPEKYKRQAILAVKDEYTLDFLELSDEHSERELEAAIVNNIRKMLIELGGYFTFIGNQYRLDVGGREYFIDLLLYHRQLRCIVAVELKIGEFKPEYAGKMQFYLTALNEQVKLEEENPSIGMIFCKEKNRIVVEYALRDAAHPMGVATYKITQILPKNLKGLLPSQKEIQDKLKGLE